VAGVGLWIDYRLFSIDSRWISGSSIFGGVVVEYWMFGYGVGAVAGRAFWITLSRLGCYLWQ